MPLVKPKENEERGKFIERCMSDTESQSEYPENAQRLAVCSSLFKDKNKKEEYSMQEDIKKKKTKRLETRRSF